MHATNLFSWHPTSSQVVNALISPSQGLCFESGRRRPNPPSRRNGYLESSGAGKRPHHSLVCQQVMDNMDTNSISSRWCKQGKPERSTVAYHWPRCHVSWELVYYQLSLFRVKQLYMFWPADIVYLLFYLVSCMENDPVVVPRMTTTKGGLLT